MINKPFNAIDKTDIESLLANQVPEGRTLDYKLTLPGGKDDDRKEFLADASSFANAAGGDLIFGLREEKGVPVEIPGIRAEDPDLEIRRMEQMLLAGIEPRLPGVEIRAIAGFSQGLVFIIRVPRSFAFPHMVTFKNASTFYTRNNVSKAQMDVGELRAAFAVSEALGERLQRFRTERLSKIIAGETPVSMSDGPKIVLHILPFSSFILASYIDSRLQRILLPRLKPMRSGGGNYRHNLDGFVICSGSPRKVNDSFGYCQLFRTGAVESVAVFVYERDGRLLMPGGAYEDAIIKAVTDYLAGLSEIQVPMPMLITLSLVGFKGVELGVEPRYVDDDAAPIDRDVLLLPDIVLEQFDVDVPRLLRPIFDAVWNAAGYERSLNYDLNGKRYPAAGGY